MAVGGLCALSAVELRARLVSGQTCAAEVCEAFLRRAEALDPSLHAFHTLTPERARECARRLDDERREHPQAPLPPLWGIPFADKDLFDRAGVRTTAGSRAFADRIAQRDDPLVAALDRAGGVSLGKTATPEFGMNGYTENLVFPAPRNPWATECGPGGSSGGAAVAVSARMLPVAPGNDGGGSIRIPAAACGLVGLKPGRGLIAAQSGVGSLGGLVTAGAIARSAADTALLLDAMTPRLADGRIAQPTATSETGVHTGPGAACARVGELLYSRAVADWLARDGLTGVRIAWSVESPWSPDYDIVLEPAARSALAAALADLAADGVDMVGETALPDALGFAASFRTVWHANMAVLGSRLPEAALLRLEPMTRWAIASGSRRTAVDVGLAVEAFAAFERAAVAAFDRFDVLVTPALAQTPRPVGWFDADDPERNFAQQCAYEPYTSWVNVAGLPALAVPAARVDGVPMGVQLVGAPGSEALLLGVAARLQRTNGSAGWDPDPTGIGTDRPA